MCVRWRWSLLMQGTFIKSGCKDAVKRKPCKMVWFLPPTAGRCEMKHNSKIHCFPFARKLKYNWKQLKIFTKENVKDFWTKNTKTFSETVISSPHWLITVYQLFMELLSVNRLLTGNSIMHDQWSSTANNQTPRKSPVANLTVASVSCNRSGRNPPITRQPPPAARFPGCSL